MNGHHETQPAITQQPQGTGPATAVVPPTPRPRFTLSERAATHPLNERVVVTASQDDNEPRLVIVEPAEANEAVVEPLTANEARAELEEPYPSPRIEPAVAMEQDEEQGSPSG